MIFSMKTPIYSMNRFNKECYSLHSISAHSLWYHTIGQWSQEITACFSFRMLSLTARYACVIAEIYRKCIIQTTTLFPHLGGIITTNK